MEKLTPEALRAVFADLQSANLVDTPRSKETGILEEPRT